MKLCDLKIENFLAISSASLNLDSRGLVLIQGNNQDDTSADSNGAGKSTIADALCWCLYGETARGESGDKIVNRKAGKNTRVELTVVDGADTYKIARHRKHKEGKNALRVSRLDGTDWADMTGGTDKITQETVLKIIGSSYEVFRSSIYAGQENFPDLPGMTDRNLKSLVEEAAGTTVLEAAYEVARQRAGDAKKTHVAASSKVEEIARRLGQIETDRDASVKDAAEWNKLRDERKAQALEQVRIHAKAAKDAVALLGGRRAVITGKIADLDAKLAAVKGEQDEERRLTAVVGRAEGVVTAIKTEIERRKREAEAQKKRVEGFDHRVGCPCDECGKAYTAEDIAPAKTRATDDLKKMLLDLRSIAASLESAQNDAESARRALEAHRASMTDVSETNAQRASLQEELHHVAADERYRDSCVKDAKGWKERADAIAAEENPHNKTITRLIERFDAAKVEIEDAKKAAGEAETLARQEGILVDIFSPAGVRAHILDHVTPFLNAQTAKYLAVLSDGNIQATWSTLTKSAKGELREKFAIEVSSTTGGESFGLISGGEKRKVRIASALALQDLVSSRATKPIELFIGDEVDDALDPAGLERLMMILEEKARERGTVLVISHSSLRDWISQIIIVTKKDGASTIEEMAE